MLVEVWDLVPGTDPLAHVWGLLTGFVMGLGSAWPGPRHRLLLVVLTLALLFVIAGLVAWRDLTFSCHG